MRSRGPGRTRVLRVAGAAALAAALLAAGPPGAAQPAPTAVISSSGLTSVTLTSVGSDGAAATAPSMQAAVAADGRYAAFESQAALATTSPRPGSSVSPHNGSAATSQIYVRDLVGRTTSQVSNPAGGAATAPDISANGNLVSYEQDGNVEVASRQATGGFTSSQVTGTANDLTYERQVPCPAGLGTGRVAPCGPKLSADGSTLVYPAELSPVSPDLSITAMMYGSGATALAGDMIDFTPYSQEYPFPGGQVTIAYYNQTSPVSYSKVTITEPAGFPKGEPFELSGSNCSGTLEPPGSCTLQVTFNSEACTGSASPQLLTGRLITHSPEPAAQSAIELTALCYQADDGPREPSGRAGAAPSGRAGCPTPPQHLALVKAPDTSSDMQGAPLINAGGVEVSRPYVIWTPVTHPPQAFHTPAYVDFAGANSTDCGIQLVNPAQLRLADPLPADAPPACRQHEKLASSGSSCTAYLLISPDAVAPDAGFLGTTYEQTSVGPAAAATAYITVQGIRHVIVARRDPGGSGNFATSPSTVVSVTSGGGDLPGATEPSVSADGRYVGFAAPVPIGIAGQQPLTGASQVWLHDTGKAGNHSYHPGATTLVSCLPRARAGPCVDAPDADSPAVSGNGQQVAFATTAAVVPHNGYPGTTGSTGAGAPGPRPPGTPGPTASATAGPSGGKPAAVVSADQVYLRSVKPGVTTLVSAQPSRTQKHASLPAGGNGPSYAPAITQDGSTVAFVSRATDLAGAPAASGAENLYLRPAVAGTATDEIASASGASLPAGTVVGMPSIDAIGRLATFPASSALTAGAPPGVVSVYTFGRLPQLGAAPPGASFGSVLIDGTHRRTVTVTDTGPGPGTVTAAAVSRPFTVASDGCLGVTLHQGGQCQVQLTFTSPTAGVADGTLTMTTENDDEPPVSNGIPTTATVPAPRLTTSPGVASAGQTTEVTGTLFPAGKKITLSWVLGLGSVVVTPSRSGTFRTYMEIFPSDITGPRTLIASAPSGGGPGSSVVLAKGPFLVAQPEMMPPSTAAQPPP